MTWPVALFVACVSLPAGLLIGFILGMLVFKAADFVRRLVRGVAE